MKDIAVLMSVYNPGSELRLTLDSLRAQTVPFTLYLVDDGSRPKPDYTALLCGLDVRLIELSVNRGISVAVNCGLAELLKNEHAYVARMDCGDIAHPERLEVQRRFLEGRPEVGIVGTGALMVVEERGWTYGFAVPSGHQAIRRALRLGMPFVNPTLMIRASVFRDIGHYSDEFRVAEDYELACRAAKYGVGFANIQRILLRKIENAGSISRRRRTIQLVHRLQIQWRYRDATDPLFLLGVAKTLFLLTVPAVLIDRLKMVVRGRRRSGATDLEFRRKVEKMVGAAGFEPATPTPPE